MNEYEICQRLKEVLQHQRWTGGVPMLPVFTPGAIKVTKNLEQQMYLTLETPAALIMPGDFFSDPVHSEEPDYRVGSITVRILVSHQDSTGEALILGANKLGGLTSSQGRGLAEIEVELYNAIKYLNAANNVEVVFSAKGGSGVIPQTNRGYRGYQDFNFEVVCDATPTRPAPPTLQAVVNGNNVTLSWILPPPTPDQIGLLLLRGAGNIPPSIPLGGVSLGVGAFATSFVDTAINGQWSYILAMEYTDPLNSPGGISYSNGTSVTVLVGPAPVGVLSGYGYNYGFNFGQ